MDPSTEVLLHPVRWRVVQALTAGPRTIRELRDAVTDVPQATLYRHIQPLVEGGLVEVVAETPARGAIERTYALTGSRTSAEDLDVPAHRRAFAFLQAAQAAEVEAYLAGPGADPRADGLSYSQATIHLDDAEREVFAAELDALVRRHLAPSSPAARAMTLGILLVPPTR